MSNQVFHEGHRTGSSFRQYFSSVTRLLPVQSVNVAIPLRTCIQQPPPHVLLDIPHTDRRWGHGPIGRLAGIWEGPSFAHPFSMRENKHAECEAGKELLFM
jgi:hypothetical protein